MSGINVSYGQLQKLLLTEKHCLQFRLTCYKSFMSRGIKDSSLRLYMCHHVEEGGEEERVLLTIARDWREVRAGCAMWWLLLTLLRDK